MNDPYLLLGISEETSDEQVQAAYHRLLRIHPPEHSPERFAAVSEAYEAVRTLEARVQGRLFGLCPHVRQLDELIRDVDRRLPCLPAATWLAESQRLWLVGKLDGSGAETGAT